jgi:hypothetical protein
VLLAFRRPTPAHRDTGTDGARLIAVARGERLWAVFPAERAVYEGAARATDLESLLGVALSPSEVMDLLTGVPSPRVRAYPRALGRRAAAPDRRDAARRRAPQGHGRGRGGARDHPGPAAFTEPPHDGYRSVDADQARALWSAR